MKLFLNTYQLKISLVLSTVLFILALPSKAQETDSLTVDSLITLRGKIINIVDKQSIGYATIVNPRTATGTIADAEGQFTIDLLPTDSIRISAIGFSRKTLAIPEGHKNPDGTTITLEPMNYHIDEVKAVGEKKKIDLGLETGTPVDIDPKYRGDSFNEKPNLGNALVSPMSFMQYHFSKSEKQKRNVLKEIEKEKKWEQFSKSYNKETVMELTGLNEAYADTFILWFNGQQAISYTASEYQVQTAIKRYFSAFKRAYNLE